MTTSIRRYARARRAVCASPRSSCCPMPKRGGAESGNVLREPKSQRSRAGPANERNSNATVIRKTAIQAPAYEPVLDVVQPEKTIVSEMPVWKYIFMDPIIIMPPPPPPHPGGGGGIAMDI
eukprot:Amastigsp_a843300_14.p6 type:complete len:121 gc:universal Amastigsp_a843300_14:2150-2512(+)